MLERLRDVEQGSLRNRLAVTVHLLLANLPPKPQAAHPSDCQMIP
jgi:hypothetical protein